jgi:hypothetical protein
LTRVCGEVDRVARRHGVVPAGGARTLEGDLHDALGVVGELHRLPYPDVGEGLLRGEHRQHVPLGVLHARDGGPVGGGDHTGGREVEVGLGQQVDLAREQGVRAGRHVGDRVEGDGVEDGSACPVVPVGGDAAGSGGREGLQSEGAGADAGAADGLRAAVRDDVAVVVREQARELGVRGLERDDEGVGVGGAQLLRVDERGEYGGLRGRRRLVEDVAERVGRVGGGEGAAVVEGDALAEPEAPGARLAVGLPGLGQVGGEFTARVDADQPVVEGAQVFVRRQGARRVQGLGVGGGGRAMRRVPPRSGAPCAAAAGRTGGTRRLCSRTAARPRPRPVPTAVPDGGCRTWTDRPSRYSFSRTIE